MYLLSNLIIWSLVLIGSAVCPRWWWNKTNDSTNNSTNLCEGASFSPEPETAAECTQECESQCGHVIQKGHPPVPIKTGVFEKKNGKRLCNCQFSRDLYRLIKRGGCKREELKKHERNIKEARKWLKQNGFRTQLVSFSEDTLPLKSDGDPVMTPERCKSTCRGSMGCVVYGPECKAIAEGNATPSSAGTWRCNCKINLQVGKAVKDAGLSFEEFFEEFLKGGSASCNWLRAKGFKFQVHCPDDSSEHADNAKPSSELKLQRTPTMKPLRRMPTIRREDEQPSSSGRDSNGTRSPSPSKPRRGADNED